VQASTAYETQHELQTHHLITISNGRASSTLVRWYRTISFFTYNPAFASGSFSSGFATDCRHVNGLLIGAQMGRKRQRMPMAQTGEATAADWTSFPVKREEAVHAIIKLRIRLWVRAELHLTFINNCLAALQHKTASYCTGNGSLYLRPVCVVWAEATARHARPPDCHSIIFTTLLLQHHGELPLTSLSLSFPFALFLAFLGSNFVGSACTHLILSWR